MVITECLHEVSANWFPKASAGKSRKLNRDDFQLRIDFLFEHAFDCHQRAGE
jgi:hypothetical protein